MTVSPTSPIPHLQSIENTNITQKFTAEVLKECPLLTPGSFYVGKGTLPRFQKAIEAQDACLQLFVNVWVRLIQQLPLFTELKKWQLCKKGNAQRKAGGRL